MSGISPLLTQAELSLWMQCMHDPTTGKPLEDSVLIAPCGYSISASTAKDELCPICKTHVVSAYIPNFSLRGLEPLMHLIQEHAASVLSLIADTFSGESRPQLPSYLRNARFEWQPTSDDSFPWQDTNDLKSPIARCFLLESDTPNSFLSTVLVYESKEGRDFTIAISCLPDNTYIETFKAYLDALGFNTKDFIGTFHAKTPSELRFALGFLAEHHYFASDVFATLKQLVEAKLTACVSTEAQGQQSAISNVLKSAISNVLKSAQDPISLTLFKNAVLLTCGHSVSAEYAQLDTCSICKQKSAGYILNLFLCTMEKFIRLVQTCAHYHLLPQHGQYVKETLVPTIFNPGKKAHFKPLVRWQHIDHRRPGTWIHREMVLHSTDSDSLLAAVIVHGAFNDRIRMTITCRDAHTQVFSNYLRACGFKNPGRTGTFHAHLPHTLNWLARFLLLHNTFSKNVTNFLSELFELGRWRDVEQKYLAAGFSNVIGSLEPVSALPPPRKRAKKRLYQVMLILFNRSRVASHIPQKCELDQKSLCNLSAVNRCFSEHFSRIAKPQGLLSSRLSIYHSSYLGMHSVALRDKINALSDEYGKPLALTYPQFIAGGVKKHFLAHLYDIITQGAITYAKVFPCKREIGLLHAVKNGSAQDTGALLAVGAHIDTEDKDGYTPLHLAAQYGKWAVFHLLLKAKANPNARDKSGDTPLIAMTRHWNRQFRSPEALARPERALAMHRLIDAKADVNACNLMGDSALTFAKTFYQEATAVKILLSHGANLLLPDPSYQTAYRLSQVMAAKTENDQVLKIFESSPGVAVKSTSKKKRKRKLKTENAT